MALVDRRIPAETVVIAATVDIPDVHAGTPGKDNRDGMVVMGTIFLFELEILER